MNHRFWKDESGILRAECQTLPVLASFLEEDLQSCASSSEEIILMAEKLRNSDIEKWESTGNAHSITIGGGRVLVSNNYTDRVDELPLDEFVSVLKSWKIHQR